MSIRKAKQAKASVISDVQMPSFTLFYISTSAIEGQTELCLKVTVLSIRWQCILRASLLFLESKRSTAGRSFQSLKVNTKPKKNSETTVHWMSGSPTWNMFQTFSSEEQLERTIT
jgi:hypothetical protein